jgi:uncharacterized protein YdaU (DUF1376 family)
MIKDVPYFPFYAANMMSSRSFRLMSLKERGLLITIMMECWINGSVPSDLSDMAKILGLTIDEVKSSYTNLHSTFLHVQGGQIISKELEGYRQGYLATREKQRLAGIESANKKKQKEFGGSLENQGQPSGLLSNAPLGQPEGSSVQINSNSFSSNQLLKKGLLNDENKSWIDAYDRAPEAISYLKASRG